jgi:prepilin-type N-terminal cleavage/methylation domain-containing protein
MGLIRRLQKRDEKPEAPGDIKEDLGRLRPTTRLFRKWDAPLQPELGPGRDPESKPERAGAGRDEDGFTLLEMMMVVIMISCLTLGLFKLFAAANTLFRSGDVKADIEEHGRMAMMSIANDLRQTGYFTDPVSGKSYPYIFTDGNAQSPFSSQWHAAAHHSAEAGSPAHGPTREIVFRMTADLDGNGVRTSAATGQIEWGPAEISYVLVTASDGVNELQRRVNGGSPTIVARYVERVCFDDSATDSNVPYGQVRLTLHMRKTTTDGRVVKTIYSTLIKMRNYE